MPGAKNKSGRRQKNPLNDCTPYLMRKSWAALDKEFAILEVTNPQLWAEIQENRSRGDMENEFAGDFDFAHESRSTRFMNNTGHGRERENYRRAISAIGAGRVRHAVNSDAEALQLAVQILHWRSQGKSKSNIAVLASNRTNRGISVKAVKKLLDDYAEKQEGQMQ